MEFVQDKLDNGLTILGELNPSAQSAAIGFFVKTGSRDESLVINGVSHFLEHMLFKGAPGLSALEVNLEFDRLGAKYNAFTSEENTVYYAAVLPERLEEVTTLWTKLMRPSLLDDDFNMEKNVIKEEIAMYKDYPHFDVIDQCRTLHFGNHPCGNSVLGTNASIDAMTAGQMRSYFESRYAPNNIIVACCGNADFSKITSLIRKQCSAWISSDADRTLSFSEGTKEHKFQKKEILKQQHICLMSPGVGAQDPRRFVGSLLSTIIGDSTGSRYFWALIDTAIAETAVMHFEAMDGVGVFYSYFRTAPENVQKTLNITREILAKLEKEGITEDELEKAKRKVLSSVALKCETPMGRLVNLGFNWTYSKEYRSVADDVEAIRSITCEQVNEMIREFRPAAFSSFSQGPLEL